MILNMVYAILSQVIWLVVVALMVWGGIMTRRYLIEKKLNTLFQWVPYLIWTLAFYFFAYNVVFSVVSFVISLTSSSAGY